MKNILIKIISQLISARLERGLSQEQLAKLIGTQRSNICRIESGSQNLSVDMLIKICNALGKDINISLEERGEPMSNIYNLKLYNETLITFSLEEKGLEGLSVQIHSVREELKEVFPLSYSLYRLNYLYQNLTSLYLQYLLLKYLFLTYFVENSK